MANQSEPNGYPIPQHSRNFMANLRSLASVGKKCFDGAASIRKNCWPCALLIGCLLFITVTILGLLVTIILIIVSLAIGDPTQPDISIVSASVSSFNLSSIPAKLSADFYFTLSVTNPNKGYALQYYSIDAALLHSPESTSMLHGTIPSFHQSKRSTTTIQVNLVADGKDLAPYVAWDIHGDMTAHKVFLFDMNLTAQVSFKPALCPAWELNVLCKDIAIWFASPDAGSKMGPTMSCTKIHNRRW